MPRKTSKSRKGGARMVKKPSLDDDVKTEEQKPVRKAKEEVEVAKTRKSSTAAQPAVSATEARGRRNRKKTNSSASVKGKTQESVRSSRRSTGRVNYKESDGEEEVITTKKDEDFDSDVEFDSDSDEKSKAKKATRSPPKRAASTKGKSKSHKAARGRKTGRRKSRVELDEEEDEQEDPIEESDASEEMKSDDSPGKKEKEVETVDSSAGRKSSSTAKAKSENKSGQKRSSRTVKESPISHRPSRSTKVKKYTEVDEDFDDEEPKSEEEKDEKPQESTSRKRKRESSEVETSKRQKKEPASDEEVQPVAVDETKPEQKDDSELSEEPMEVDESLCDEKKEEVSKEPIKSDKATESKMELTDSQTTVDSEIKPVQSPKASEPADKIKTSSDSSSNVLNTPISMPPEEKEDKASIVHKEKPAESKDSTPHTELSVIKTVERELPKANLTIERDEVTENSKAPEKLVQPVQPTFQDSAFPVKEAVSVNGETERSVIKENISHLNKSVEVQFQNSSPPKTNGAHGDTRELVHNREYVENSSALNLVKEHKDSFLCFGFVSCNLSVIGINKDKLVHELDKNASIICLQNVSKSLLQCFLKANFDALGFRAAVSWMKDSEIGLVTFYKSSVFRLAQLIDIPVQKLVQKHLDSSGLDETEKSIVSRCTEQCGHVLFTQLTSVHQENVTLTVANIKLPTTSTSLHSLQMACLNQELVVFSEQLSKPLLVCGEFNAIDTDIPYQILRQGKPTEQMIGDLRSRAENSENAAIVKLLQNISHNPFAKLSSCYVSTLGKELAIPESKKTSPELLLVSSDKVHTIRTLDFPPNYEERRNQGQVPLKADIAVALPKKEFV